MKKRKFIKTMKTLFIPAKSKYKLDESEVKEFAKQLPKKIAIAYSIQFKEIAKQIEKILSKDYKITQIIQILGCSKLKLENAQAVLLIGSGKFHAISLAINSKKPIYILENNEIKEISKKEIQDFTQSKKSSYVKFLNSKKIGVLISIKPGQEKLKKALNLKIKNKKIYFFIANELNSQEFENFEIESWVNTACPRMDMNDSRIVNIGDLNLSNTKNRFQSHNNCCRHK